MHKIIYLILFFIISFCHLYGLELLSNSKKAKDAIAILERLDDYHQLVKEIDKEGRVKLVMLDLDEDFDAFWNSTQRTIRINLKKNESMNVLLSSILFEMHNAKTDKRFKQLYTMAQLGQISKEKYVENVERMEHQNALNCSILLEKGIRLGLFPEGCRWPILRNFDDHYKVQQLQGHSQWLANSYVNISPNHCGEYKGTIPKGIILSSQDKSDMLRYLRIKNDLESPTETQALKGFAGLQKEYRNLEACYLGMSSQNCMRTSERIKLLEHVFQENKIYQTMVEGSSIHLIAHTR